MRFETGRIEFREVRELSWSGQGAPPATDANGEGDYGSIDEFVWDQASYSAPTIRRCRRTLGSTS